jgi:Mn2+/Fe2+ NRAMP family transporter
VKAVEPQFEASHRAPAGSVLGRLGPGLISGASDDDPTAIGTYCQTGALFGYAFCWLSILCFPIAAAVQEISGRVGQVTGQGLAANIRRHYSPWLLNVCVVLLFCANAIAIGADIGAMAEVTRLLAGGPHLAYVVLFGALCVALLVFVPYRRYITFLKWGTLSLLTYIVAVFLAGVKWRNVLAGFTPVVLLTSDWITIVVLIFGAAISPYVFFWESVHEAEEARVDADRRTMTRERAMAELKRIRFDTYVGMGVATVVSLSIMITTAAALHAAGVARIESSAQAAEALRPAAGPLAYALFAAGIVGTGLLAIPVLAGSAAYAIGEARQWPVGLSRRPREAKAFYATLVLATAIGMTINLIGINPMRALVLSAVANGIVAAPMLAMMIMLASRRDVMGHAAIGSGLRTIGWAAVILMLASVVLMAALAVL